MTRQSYHDWRATGRLGTTRKPGRGVEGSQKPQKPRGTRIGVNMDPHPRQKTPGFGILEKLYPGQHHGEPIFWIRPSFLQTQAGPAQETGNGSGGKLVAVFGM